jgi:hypothetical protein
LLWKGGPATFSASQSSALAILGWQGCEHPFHHFLCFLMHLFVRLSDSVHDHFLVELQQGAARLIWTLGLYVIYLFCKTIFWPELSNSFAYSHDQLYLER